jgi:signal transduction histidine kinase
VPRRITWLSLLFLFTLLDTLPGNTGQRRVLIVFGHNPHSPGAAAFNASLRRHFVQNRGIDVEFYSELLDFDRFPDRSAWPKLAQAMAEKYRLAPPEVIVTEGAAALLFSVEHLRRHFPAVPIVYAVTFEPIIDYSTFPTNVTGRRQHPGFAATLQMAKRLQPEAERVVLIGGASAMDSAMFGEAVRQVRPLLGGMTLVPMQDWTYPTLLQALRRLPPRTIVLLSSFRRDQRGWAFNSGDLISSITHVASAPVYGIARNWIGDGIVGGAVLDFAAEGSETARILELVLRRPRGAPLPKYEEVRNPLFADARQLQRWDLPVGRLPGDVEVANREATLWQRHKVLALVTMGIVIAQLTLIVLLLLERQKRRRAQRDVEETRGQVTHIARVATVGQITAAVSHELRQPLTAIHASAQAGELLLRRPDPDLTEVREIFDSIVSADERAVDIIDHIRGLLRNEHGQGELVDLNLVCGRSMQLLDREVNAHYVRLVSRLAPELSLVRGDAVQLQQVVINLILNGLDATMNADGARSITVGTREGIAEVELYVHNNGPPLSAEVQNNLFSAFFSTKSKGLGMGLAIVRMIVERHHGVVNGRNHQDGGVVFSVTLPKA